MTPETAAAPALTLLDRALSWLEFNRRVLHEALDPRTPLLERVKFLAIFSSNLDEFFMKRVGVLTGRLAERSSALALDGAPARHLQAVREKVLELTATQAEVYTAAIRPALADAGIHLLEWGELTDPERRYLADLFRRAIYPVLTPLAVDPAHPFPFLSNLSQSVGLLLKAPGAAKPSFARVKVPAHLPQWIRLPAAGPPADAAAAPVRFVPLLDVLRNHLDALFPGTQVLE